MGGREHRILLTFDKDFGELARGSALPRTCGVVLLRMPMPKPEEAGVRLAAPITAREDWAGNFSVIEPGRVRMRPLGVSQLADRRHVGSRRSRSAAARGRGA
jgi:hypothetical protein